MKPIISQFFAATVAAVSLVACEQMELVEDEAGSPQQPNSLLQVRTRAGGEETEVSYPVSVYVFSGEECKAVQTIGSADETLSIPLVEGTYSVYAIGGASSDDYVLPTKEEATPTTPITLREGKKHGDVMAGKNSGVVLVDGGTNALTLSLERKVMLLESIELNKIPTAATAVSVTLSPLWENIVGTAYSGENGAETVGLTRSDENNRTWLFTGPLYLLPPAEQPATITVSIVQPGGTSSYTYSTDQLEAAYKVGLKGTYTEAVGVTLTGTITGSAWKGERTISFEFNDNGSQAATDDGDTDGGTGSDSGDTGSAGDDADNGNGAADDDIITGTIPTVGSTYQGCYVASVKATGDVSEVLLVSSKQKTMNFAGTETLAEATAKVEAELPGLAVDGIGGWRLMTLAEATTIRPNRRNIANWNTDARYIIDSNGATPATFGTTQVSTAATYSPTDILRPVAIIKMRAN